MGWHRMAKKMLGIEDEHDLPDELEKRLQAIEDMIHLVKPHGNLESSQVVASVVEQWTREQLGGL